MLYIHIEINTIDIGSYNISFLKGQSSYKSMWFTILFVILIITKEISNMDMYYAFFQMCVLFSKFRTNDPISELTKKCKFYTQPYIIIPSFCLFSKCEFFNFINTTRILNFIICICIYINFYTFIFYSASIFFHQYKFFKMVRS